MLQDTFEKNSVPYFTHDVNKNNKIPFLDVLIDTTTYNDKLTLTTYQKPTNNNSCTLNFKRLYLFRYKLVIINNLIYRARLISSTIIIFYKESKDIIQILINHGFLNYIVEKQTKRVIKNFEPTK